MTALSMPVWFRGILLYNGRFCSSESNRHETDLDVSGVLQPVATKCREQLKPYQEQFGFELDIVDVDEDPVLEEKYNELVPVLLDGDTEICHWFLDEEKLKAHLSA